MPENKPKRPELTTKRTGKGVFDVFCGSIKIGTMERRMSQGKRGRVMWIWTSVLGYSGAALSKAYALLMLERWRPIGEDLPKFESEAVAVVLDSLDR